VKVLPGASPYIPGCWYLGIVFDSSVNSRLQRRRDIVLGGNTVILFLAASPSRGACMFLSIFTAIHASPISHWGYPSPVAFSASNARKPNQTPQPQAWGLYHDHMYTLCDSFSVSTGAIQP